ncbi:3-hydroxybutyryl-coa dehydratase [hydrocarbon metagenome]|uniref:3-hydroxybutyryl-coa dehydratase n=1 Tax=hydrocarbon metagenome TaxID=938273 RepID=A0A0W8E3L2_9ZZZZ
MEFTINSTIEVEVKESGVAILSLNRPDRWNAVNIDMLCNLEKIQDNISRDKAIKAVVINANGIHFSVGMDLDALKSFDYQYILEKIGWLQYVYSRWQQMSIPVIAAVQGYCVGSGVEMILGCDIRIAADTARFRLPEVSLGLAPDMGGTTRLTKLIGVGQAKRMIMGCEEAKAEEALRIGLVELVVKEEELNARALSLAEKMAAYPPLAISWAKKGINLAQDNSTEAALLFEQAQSAASFGSEDLKEAIAAFVEKRKPEFKGR